MRRYGGGTALLTIALSICALAAPPAAFSQEASSSREDPQSATQKLTPPTGALKYHKVLLRRPNPGYLFDRFFNAWLDEAPVAELEAFLKQRADRTASDGLLLAFFYAKGGDDLLAIEQFRKTLEQNPDNAAAWYEKAVLEARTLDFETALADLAKAATANEESPRRDAPLALRIAKLRGQLLVRSGKRGEALKVFGELIAGNPTDEELAEDVIELQLAEGLYDEAAAATEQLIERTKDPYRKVLRRLRLGDIRQQAGRRDEAITIYRKTLNDVGAESWLEREILAQVERVYRREEDISGLKKEYLKLLEAFPRRVGVRRGYARVLADAGESAEAIEQFKAILKITPGDRANQEAFIQLYLRTGDHAGARRQLEALIEQTPDDAELYVQLADLAKKTKDKNAAVKAVQQFLSKSDQSEYAHLRAARLLERLEYTDEAKAEYATLIETFPKSPAAKEAAAGFLYKTGAKDEAIALWKYAAAGDDPQQAVRVARALAARQEHDAAFALLNERRDAFAGDALFLAQLVDEALAVKKYEAALPFALRRVDLATAPTELDDAVSQAAKVIERGEMLAGQLARLQGEAKTPQRTCLLAELLERSGDVQQADAVLEPLVEEGGLLAVSQQIRLAQQRRDWRLAIESLRKLIDLPGGRKSRNVRRLVEFYERDFQIAKALEWIPEWKKLSPGSTSPWLAETRLLLIDGKDAAAMDRLRTAAREFDGADEIRTRLAQLYQSSGKLADAERLYWRTYEDADDLVGKLRAVEQLARSAEQQGKTAALVANFEERRRERRTSIEPLMALATIYRATDNYEKRLQTLAEAAKQRPDDLPLLRQIARIEEREGDWERARDTLQRAMKLDKTGGVRRQLASLHLRWGNPEEGYALLQQAMEEGADDPREIEAVADAMIAAGDWDRAIEFLEPRVDKWPDDYRLRYLLGTAHEEVGSLGVAAQHFVHMLAAEQEVKVAAPAKSSGQNAYYEQLYGIAPPGVKELIQARHRQHQVYRHRQQRGAYRTGLTLGAQSNLTMPSDAAEARQYALVHLGSILQLVDDDKAESLRESVAASDIPEAEVIMTISSGGRNHNAAVAELVERFPQRESLVAYVILGMGGRAPGVEADFYRDAVERFAEPHPQVALVAAVQGMMLHEENADLADRANELLAELERPASITVMMLCTLPTQLAQRGGGAAGALPKEFHKQLRDKVVAWYPLVRDSQPYGQWIFNYMASMLRTGDDPTAYLQLLSDEVTRFRQNPSQTAQIATNFARQGRGKLLSEPTFPPTGLQRFPTTVMSLVNTRPGQQGVVYFPGQQNQPGWDDEQLASTLPTIKDPTLRLLLAHKLEKEEIVAQAIAELLAAETPTLDSYFLAAGWEVAQERPAEAIELLEKARYLPMDRATRRVVDGQLLALVLDRLGSGGRVEQKESLVKTGREAALRLRHGTLQANDRMALATALEELGLTKEAERLENSPAAVAAASARPNVQAYASRSSVAADRIRRLIDNKKSDAAAKLLSGEVLGLIRQQGAGYGNISYTNYQYRQLRQRVQKYGLETKVLGSLDPGDSTNHRRHAEYAAALKIFQKGTKAYKAYERALELRPREDDYRVQLVIEEARAGRLPEAKARLANLGRQGPTLLVQMLLGSFSDNENELAVRMRMAEVAIALFEQEMKKPRGELAWAPNFRRNFSNPQHTRNGNLPGLYAKHQPTSSSNKSAKYAEARREHHDALCRAMLEVDYLAADGFTGLLAAHEAAAGSLDDDALTKFRDMAARALKRTKRPPPTAGPYPTHTVYYSTNPAVATERSPGEFLVRYCYGREDWSVLDDDVLPDLEAGSGASLAREIEDYRRLYDCPEKEFADAAKSFVRQSPTPQHPSVTRGAEQMKVYEAWRDRNLQIDLRPVMLSFVKQALAQANPHAALPFVIEYTEALATKEGPEAAADWLEELATLYIGPREKRQELIAKNYQRNHISWGTPNAAIHGFANTLQQCLQKGPLVLPAVHFMSQGKVGGLVRNVESSLRNGLRLAMPVGDAEQTLDFLEKAGLLKDPPELMVGDVGSGQESFYEGVRNHLRRYFSGDSKRDLREKLAAREVQTLGVRILRVAMDDDQALLKDFILHIGERVDELSALAPAYRTALAARMGEGTEKLKGELAATFGESAPLAEKALDWLAAQQTARATGRVGKILAMKRYEELKIEAHELDEWFGDLLPDLAGADPRGAAKVFFKVIDLYEDAIGRNVTHHYYGGDATAQLARQLSYRMDRQSPAAAVLVAALLEGDDANRLTMTRSDVRNYLQPLTNQLVRYQGQAQKAKAGPTQIIKPYYTWLRETFGKHASPILAAAFVQDFQRFNPNDLKEMEKWLAKRATTASDHGLADDLLAAVRLQRERRRRDRSRKNDPSAAPPKHYQYYEQVLSDSKRPLAVRLTLANVLYETERDRLPGTTTRVLAHLGAEACGAEIPLNYSLERCLSDVAWRLTDEADQKNTIDEAAQKFIAAWVKRFAGKAALVNSGSSNPNRASDSSSILKIMAACYAQGDADVAKRIYRAYRDRIGRYRETLGLLAREGEIADAATLVRTGWNEFSISPLRPSPVVYDERLHEAMPKLKEKLGPGPFAYFAELILSDLGDIPKKQIDGRWRPREHRLRDLAKQFDEAGFQSSGMTAKGVLMFRRDAAATDLIAGPLQEAAKKIDVVRMARAEDPNFDTGLELALQHGQWALRQGDPTPLTGLFVKMAESDLENNWRLQNAYRNKSRELAEALTKHLGKLDRESLVAATKDIIKLTNAPNDFRIYDYWRLNTFMAVAHARYGSLETYKPWWGGIRDKELKERIRREGVDPRIFELAREDLDTTDPSTVDQRIERLAGLMDLLSWSAWMHYDPMRDTQFKSRGGTRVLRPMEMFFTGEEMPTAAPAVAQQIERDASARITWMIAARALEKQGAHAEAAAAWGEVYELRLPDESYKKQQEVVKANQIEALLKAGKDAEAKEQLAETLKENLPTSKTKSRYDELRRRLKSSEAPNANDRQQDEATSREKPASRGRESPVEPTPDKPQVDPAKPAA